MIILSFIIGIILFYVTIIPSIHKLSGIPVSQKFTRRILSLPFWQIILCDLVCLYALQVEPVYKQTDEDVSSFVQEYSAIGDLVNEYTGINATSNYNYLMSEAESLHTYTIVFMVIVVIFALTAAIGSIGKKLNKRIVEGMSIIATLGCCWIAKSSTDLYEMIIRDGATLQAIAWIGRLLGTDIYLMMDLIIRSVWILPLILIIKHFYYHKALNEYYVWAIPQSRFVKQQEENEVQEQPSPQTATSSINPIEYSNTPTEENNPEFVTRDISSTNQQSEVIKSQDETITSSDIQESTLQTNENVCNDSIKVSGKKQSKFSYIEFAIGGIVIIIIAVFVVWQCTKDEDVMPILQQAQQEKVNSTTGDTQQHSTQSISDIYEQRSNAIIQELTSKYGDKLIVDYKYPTLSRYCIFRVKGEYDSTDYLLIYDLEREVLKQLEHKKLQPSNGKEEIGVYSFDVSISSSNDKMFIFAFDGVRTQYLLELDFSNWNVKKLCVGSYIEQKRNHIIVHRDCLTKLKDCYSESEFTNIDIYYDLQGKLIAPSYNGNTYYLKGLIDNKYAVTMQLSMQDNKIYGKYYYDKNGSDNELYLYGGVSDSGDVVLLEFNKRGEQTSNFIGKFPDDTFYGTFVNYKGVEMPFELCLW